MTSFVTPRVSLTAGVTLSRIIYGMWRLADDPDTSPAHVQAKVESCLDQGITTMDHADIYGDYGVEEIFGRMLAAAPHLRDRIEIVTKCGIIAPAGRHAGAAVKHYDTSAAHIEGSLDLSLRLLGVDHVDLLLIHRPDPMMDHHETGAALDRLVRAGKTRAVGVSNFRPHDWLLLQSAMETPLATNQIELSLAATGAFANGDLAFLQQRGIAPMAWSPLAGGQLMRGENPALSALLHEIATAAGVDSAAVAVAWLLAHPAGIMPVMGTNAPDRIARLSQALEVAMDRPTWFRLYSAAIGTEVP